MEDLNLAFRGDGGAVPIVITHRTVTKAPEIERKRRFVGFVEGLKSLAVKAIELIEETFWEEEREVKDLGASQVVHYAVDIFHETDGVNQFPAKLRVTQLPGTTRPACGAHFEVIKVAENNKVTPDEIIRVPDEVDEEGSIEEPLPPPDGKPKAKLIGDRPTPNQLRAPRLPINRNRQEPA
jgi:hypothetical protein